MGWILIGGIVLLLVFGPMLWVKTVMHRHSGDRPDFPGTGGELARHLLDEAGLRKVGVEVTQDGGDHYDPQAKMVRLGKDNFDGRSLTAVAVAAHEVGHALQDRDGYKPLSIRHRTIRTAAVTDTIGSAAMYVFSFAGTAYMGARAILFGVIAVVVMGLVRVLANLVTLPVELDASFNRALPILEHGRYIPREDLPGARQILRAAALTYVAGSAMQMLNFLRLLRGLR